MNASLYVFYDGACSLCTRIARLLQKLDWRRRLVLLSFRAPGVIATYGLDPARAEARLQVQVAGRTLEGIAAVEAVAARLPLLWPLWPWIVLVRRLGIGDPIYDWVARHRWVWGRRSTCAGTCAPAMRPAPPGDR
ncbi:DUF393 domain-containing protein [Thermanaerothrix sp. 4228-RoL]|uniref:DUF393 domain-containing protein n=1 Tax=Thermanaerothrix solaris TaxID=3058434 RepID=A0ABU3NPA2_9CHLR|nr:DUF393 domain-containing protein [Thermanaerothrix sp. 4228-RoL]MDT8898680.1 DUF393 domain-containing protein [Thermanaerothrix sp. 4228-RoL]